MLARKYRCFVQGFLRAFWFTMAAASKTDAFLSYLQTAEGPSPVSPLFINCYSQTLCKKTGGIRPKTRGESQFLSCIQLLPTIGTLSALYRHSRFRHHSPIKETPLHSILFTMSLLSCSEQSSRNLGCHFACRRDLFLALFVVLRLQPSTLSCRLSLVLCSCFLLETLETLIVVLLDRRLGRCPSVPSRAFLPKTTMNPITFHWILIVRSLLLAMVRVSTLVRMLAIHLSLTPQRMIPLALPIFTIPLLMRNSLRTRCCFQTDLELMA